ncbi:hypothetical protein [Henriciella sp.]|uniref:hypothetical protein n=1 Tax=Henriciella sp. TaxID=1968823 RepID=UPI0026167D62|nr:hypothetical protein [Henriciella sp.]
MTLDIDRLKKVHRAWQLGDDDEADCASNTVMESLPAIIDRLAQADAMEEALGPIAAKFEYERTRYAQRYETTELGYRKFDEMPDHWPMPDPDFSIGIFRRAREAYRATLKGEDNAR